MNAAGLSIADIFPTAIEQSDISSTASLNSSISSCCLEKALITRVPSRFSRVSIDALSSFFCVFLYIGTVLRIIVKMISEITGATTKKISDSLTSIITAITAAPITRNGALTASLMNIFTPF